MARQQRFFGMNLDPTNSNYLDALASSTGKSKAALVRSLITKARMSPETNKAYSEILIGLAAVPNDEVIPYLDAIISEIKGRLSDG